MVPTNLGLLPSVLGVPFPVPSVATVHPEQMHQRTRQHEEEE